MSKHCLWCGAIDPDHRETCDRPMPEPVEAGELTALVERIDDHCSACGGDRWLATADPDEYGEPGEPYQVDCLDSIHGIADELRAALRAEAARPSEGLDVERLAQAIAARARTTRKSALIRPRSNYRDLASDIAREYAALDQPRSGEAAPRPHDPVFWADCAEGRCPHVGEAARPKEES